MKRRVLLLTFLVLAVLIISTASAAGTAAEPKLWFHGIPICSDTSDFPVEYGTISYSYTENKLTFNNAKLVYNGEITDEEGALFHSCEDLVIEFTGYYNGLFSESAHSLVYTDDNKTLTFNVSGNMTLHMSGNTEEFPTRYFRTHLPDNPVVNGENYYDWYAIYYPDTETRFPASSDVTNASYPYYAYILKGSSRGLQDGIDLTAIPGPIYWPSQGNMPSGAEWNWHSQNNEFYGTLSLSDAALSGEMNSGECFSLKNFDERIVLSGENNLNVDYVYQGNGYYSRSALSLEPYIRISGLVSRLSISGNGSLNINTQNVCIACPGSENTGDTLQIDSGTINLTSSSRPCILIGRTRELMNDKGYDYLGNKLIINGGRITAVTGATDMPAIYVNQGLIEINGGTLYASAVNNTKHLDGLGGTSMRFQYVDCSGESVIVDDKFKRWSQSSANFWLLDENNTDYNPVRNKAIIITGGSANFTTLSRVYNSAGADALEIFKNVIELEADDANRKVTALGISYSGQPYSYGINDMYTDSDGKLYLWLPAGAVVETVAFSAKDEYILHNNILSKHDYNEIITTSPTCTAPGHAYCTCKNCSKQIETELPALGHSLSPHPAAAAGYWENGNQAYYECTACGHYYTAESCTEEFEENEWIIPALIDVQINSITKEVSVRRPENLSVIVAAYDVNGKLSFASTLSGTSVQLPADFSKVKVFFLDSLWPVTVCWNSTYPHIS